MNTSFDEIQRIIRKLSRKQLPIVKRMVEDCIASFQDYDAAQRRKPKQNLPTDQEINEIKWTSSKNDKYSDDEVIRSFNPLSRLGSTEQMERICGVGNGNALAQFERVLDNIGAKHEYHLEDLDMEDDEL